MIPLLAKYSNMSASDIGLSLTTCVQLLGMLQWGIRQSTETENLMTSVERLLEYTKLDEEPKNGSDSKSWPENGDIQFKEVNFSYDGIKDVLKNINLEIKSGEKIGIVGRTGAGKSSLTSCLFRLRELRSGKIMIGNKNIGELNLRTLRRGITVIPQEPMLISESIRENLDPYGEYSDEECWDVLSTVQLKDSVSKLDGKLGFKITSGGANFSIGERQLFCLARALLKKTKILLVDEATANVDPETDSIIQKIIRKEFHDCTTLTIAHRLNTIVDSDKVLVLDSGEVREYATPADLLDDKNSVFHKMASETSIFEDLVVQAKQSSNA